MALHTAEDILYQPADTGIGKQQITGATIMYADNIIVLENRRVVEQDTHDELMARNGAYTTLVKNQAPTNVKKDAME